MKNVVDLIRFIYLIIIIIIIIIIINIKKIKNKTILGKHQQSSHQEKRSKELVVSLDKRN